jgi:glucose-1-phosphate thymidylyltransferase
MGHADIASGSLACRPSGVCAGIYGTHDEIAEHKTHYYYQGVAAMKGVILVGGLGTRLEPMTRVSNKHLLPIWRYPMVYYPVYTLVEAGIKDILIVTGGNSPGDFLELLHDGREFGLEHLYYTYQPAPKGIADALRLVNHFINQEPFVVMLGDNIVNGSIRPYVDNFRRNPSGARLLLAEVSDPHRFGVAALDGQNRIVQIIEKPTSPPSSYAVIGIYMYDHQIWDILPNLQLSDRGQYEITDVNNAYLERGLLNHDILPFEWTDAGTPESLCHASEIARNSDFLSKLPLIDCNP